MSVRNFYIDGCVDGRETNVAGGPRNKQGGMTLTLTQRDEGSIQEVLYIDCFVSCDNKLITRVYNKLTDKLILEHETDR